MPSATVSPPTLRHDQRRHLEMATIILRLKRLREQIETEAEPLTLEQQCLLADVCAELGLLPSEQSYVLGMTPSRVRERYWIVISPHQADTLVYPIG